MFGNIRGIGDKSKRDRLHEMLLEEKLDFMCLSETKKE